MRGVSVAGFSALSYRYDFTRNLLLCQDIAVLHFSNHYPLYPTRSVCRLSCALCVTKWESKKTAVK